MQAVLFHDGNGFCLFLCLFVFQSITFFDCMPQCQLDFILFKEHTGVGMSVNQPVFLFFTKKDFHTKHYLFATVHTITVAFCF